MPLSSGRFSRRRENLLAYFEHTGEIECPQVGGHIYRELCWVVRSDEKSPAMAA